MESVQESLDVKDEIKMKDSVQYVTFTVGDESYGIDILSVREIKGWTPTTRIPNVPDWIRGVINLRGIIVPIIDLRALFSMGATDASQNHVVVIIAVADKYFGLLVDGVSDIVMINKENMQPMPDVYNNGSTQFLNGLTTVNERLVALLDHELLKDRINKINIDSMNDTTIN